MLLLIVEVGVGGFPLVALTLQEHLNMDIIMTDIKPYHDQIVVDDITNPNLNIYRDASLIYSIRPPEELQQSHKNGCRIGRCRFNYKTIFNRIYKTR